MKMFPEQRITTTERYGTHQCKKKYRMWGWGSSQPAVDPNIYGNDPKPFTDKDFDAFIVQCDDMGQEWSVLYTNAEEKVTVWQKVCRSKGLTAYR
jgi:hypothetical protein